MSSPLACAHPASFASRSSLVSRGLYTASNTTSNPPASSADLGTGLASASGTIPTDVAAPASRGARRRGASQSLHAFCARGGVHASGGASARSKRRVHVHDVRALRARRRTAEPRPAPPAPGDHHGLTLQRRRDAPSTARRRARPSRARWRRSRGRSPCVPLERPSSRLTSVTHSRHLRRDAGRRRRTARALRGAMVTSPSDEVVAAEQMATRGRAPRSSTRNGTYAASTSAARSDGLCSAGLLLCAMGFPITSCFVRALRVGRRARARSTSVGWSGADSAPERSAPKVRARRTSLAKRRRGCDPASPIPSTTAGGLARRRSAPFARRAGASPAARPA